MESHRYFRYFCFILFLATAVLTAEEVAKPKTEYVLHEELVVFQDVWLVLREKRYWDGSRKIKVFDPADTVLYPYGLPFLKLQVERNGEGYLAELARTDSLRGNQSLEFVKQWQIDNNLAIIEVIDAANSLPCPKEGTLCHNETLHELSQISLLAYGKGFYEKAGAVPGQGRKKNADYRTSADFIHGFVRASHLISDLKRVEKEIPKANATLFLLERAVLATNSRETDRISEIFLRLRAVSERDAATHQLYHEFLDRVVSDKHSLFIDMVGYFLRHSGKYETKFLELSCELFLEEVRNLVECLAAEDLSAEEATSYVFAHLPELIERMVQDRAEDTKVENGYLPRRSVAARASYESLRKTYLGPFLGISDRLEEIAASAEAYLSSCSADRDAYRNSHLFHYVAAQLRQVMARGGEAEFPPGQLYFMWYLARRCSSDYCEFVFENPTLSKEAA